jgi:hypothetical protein
MVGCLYEHHEGEFVYVGGEAVGFEGEEDWLLWGKLEVFG